MIDSQDDEYQRQQMSFRRCLVAMRSPMTRRCSLPCPPPCVTAPVFSNVSPASAGVLRTETTTRNGTAEDVAAPRSDPSLTGDEFLLPPLLKPGGMSDDDLCGGERVGEDVVTCRLPKGRKKFRRRPLARSLPADVDAPAVPPCEQRCIPAKPHHRQQRGEKKDASARRCPPLMPPMPLLVRSSSAPAPASPSCSSSNRGKSILRNSRWSSPDGLEEEEPEIFNTSRSVSFSPELSSPRSIDSRDSFSPVYPPEETAADSGALQETTEEGIDLMVNESLMEVIDFPWTDPDTLQSGLYSGMVNRSRQPHGKGTLVIKTKLPLLSPNSITSAGEADSAMEGELSGDWSEGKYVYPAPARSLLQAAHEADRHRLPSPLQPSSSSDDSDASSNGNASYNSSCEDRASPAPQDTPSHQSPLETPSPIPSHDLGDPARSPDDMYDLGDVIRSPNDMVIESDPESAIESASSLEVHDFAFVRRSDMTWTYAIVAGRSSHRLLVDLDVGGSGYTRSDSAMDSNDASEKGRNKGEEEALLFVVNRIGATKAFSRHRWGEQVRRRRRYPPLQKSLPRRHPGLPTYNLGNVVRSQNDMIVKPDYESAVRSVSSLEVHDFAFVRRSNGTWTYAILASRHSDQIGDGDVVGDGGDEGKENDDKRNITAMHFVMNSEGATKAVSKQRWGDCVRRARTVDVEYKDKDRDVHENNPGYSHGDVPS